MFHLKTCLCGFIKVRDGAFLIGVISCVTAVICFMISLHFLQPPQATQATYIEACEQSIVENQLKDSLSVEKCVKIIRIIFGTQCAFSVIDMVVSLLLIEGIQYSRYLLMIPFLIYRGLLMFVCGVLSMTLILTIYLTGHKVEGLILNFIFLGLYSIAIYLYIIVYEAYEQIRKRDTDDADDYSISSSTSTLKGDYPTGFHYVKKNNTLDEINTTADYLHNSYYNSTANKG